MAEVNGYIDVWIEDRLIPLDVQTHTIVDPSKLAHNIGINLQRPVPRFLQTSGLGIVKNEPLAIVACGPTLKDTIETVRGHKNILVCGSAHDYLIGQGITPNWAVVSDAGENDKDNITLPQEETVFLLASQCDPGLYEHLKDHKIEMWHYRGQATEGNLEAEAKLLNGEPSITWGSTVTLSSITLALYLGYQDIHFFGFDSCYGDYGLKQHVCKIAGSMEYAKSPVTLPGTESKRTFISDVNLAEQASQFFRLVEVIGKFFTATIHGDGLIAEMAKFGEPGLSEFVRTV